MRQEDINRLSQEAANYALDLLEKEISKMKSDGKTDSEMQVFIAFAACAILGSLLVKNGKQWDSDLLDSFRFLTLECAQKLRTNPYIWGSPN